LDRSDRHGADAGDLIADPAESDSESILHLFYDH
jgi:hypothetical protein